MTAAQAAVAEHGDRLLPLLAGLAAFQPSADARRGALEALTPLASELPRHIRCEALALRSGRVMCLSPRQHEP